MILLHEILPEHEICGIQIPFLLERVGEKKALIFILHVSMCKMEQFINIFAFLDLLVLLSLFALRGGGNSWSTHLLIG